MFREENKNKFTVLSLLFLKFTRVRNGKQLQNFNKQLSESYRAKTIIVDIYLGHLKYVNAKYMINILQWFKIIWDR